jgi:hypothetical protein
MVLPRVGSHRLPYWLAIALSADRSARDSWYDINLSRGQRPKERLVAGRDPPCPPIGPTSEPPEAVGRMGGWSCRYPPGKCGGSERRPAC